MFLSSFLRFSLFIYEDSGLIHLLDHFDFLILEVAYASVDQSLLVFVGAEYLA